MNKIEEIKKKIRDLKLKQKMTTGRLEWNDIQREIDILNNELKRVSGFSWLVSFLLSV